MPAIMDDVYTITFIKTENGKNVFGVYNRQLEDYTYMYIEVNANYTNKEILDFVYAGDMQ